ncbi:hypothetical protein AB0K40_09810 [Nonomuraea bangladeshensis]|uniref:Uncharacterized protein n=1 Tax=Nonomuraea bangladeshensis TaxID=404385 RepID=A0ABV3GZT4_9ACTN
MDGKDNDEIVTGTAHQVFGLLEPALTDYAVRPVRWHEPVSSSG